MVKYDKKYSIRKVSVGAASVVIGLAAGSTVVGAADVENGPQIVAEASSENIEGNEIDESKEKSETLGKVLPKEASEDNKHGEEKKEEISGVTTENSDKEEQPKEEKEQAIEVNNLSFVKNEILDEVNDKSFDYYISYDEKEKYISRINKVKDLEELEKIRLDLKKEKLTIILTQVSSSVSSEDRQIFLNEVSISTSATELDEIQQRYYAKDIFESNKNSVKYELEQLFNTNSFSYIFEFAEMKKKYEEEFESANTQETLSILKEKLEKEELLLPKKKELLDTINNSFSKNYLTLDELSKEAFIKELILVNNEADFNILKEKIENKQNFEIKKYELENEINSVNFSKYYIYLEESVKNKLLKELSDSTNINELEDLKSKVKSAQDFLVTKKDLENEIDSKRYYYGFSYGIRERMRELVTNAESEEVLNIIREKDKLIEKLSNSRINSAASYVENILNSNSILELKELEENYNREVEREHRLEEINAIERYIKNLNFINEDKKQYYLAKLENTKYSPMELIREIKEEAYNENKKEIDNRLEKEKKIFH